MTNPMTGPNDFVTILADLDDGNIANHLTEQLRRITLAVLETKKSGAVTLKIDVKNEGRVLVLKASVSAKVPQPDTESTMFFADKDGYLRKDDPAQVPLKGVPQKAPAPLRSIEKPAPAAGAPTPSAQQG